MYTKAATITKDNVLWCYKKNLQFSSNQKKRMKQKKTMTKGEAENAFELFLQTTDISYVYYKESHKVLGNTFGMVVLQDFEAITPNILARTIETVRGGGLIVMLLTQMNSIKQLYHLNMDVNKRYRGDDTKSLTSRFNERFVLSLSDNENAIIVSDELDVIPVFEHSLKIEPVEKKVEIKEELNMWRERYEDIQYLNEIVKITTTADQAKCVIQLFDCLKEKSLNTTLSITAGRGRGKSAAMGLSIACGIALGYSNIFVTAPSPENVQTLFQFVIKGLNVFGMKEHLDYDVVQTTKTEYNKAVIRINVHQSNRQTVQYILPNDVAQLGQAELLVVDEAAAIPLPLVKKLLGNYTVMLSTTTNGYEGTGRSLSLKLIKELKENKSNYSKGRLFKECTLVEPIRYALNDKVETWLNKLLCLDASNTLNRLTNLPKLEECELFFINRDTLFSYNKEAEKFLQQLQGLFVTSHYKNSPNDLQLLADAPNHMIWVLTGPITDGDRLPDILAAVQLSIEGKISRKEVNDSFWQGKKEAGDLIPWTLTQQYLDDNFAGLTGGRVVRICTHPDAMGMGYGSKILEMLELYFTGCIVPLGDMEEVDENENENDEEKMEEIENEEVSVKKVLQPLLINPGNRKPELLDYLGVAFGFTSQLHKFWSRSKYNPMYMRMTANDITGEHSCIMVRQLTETNGNWSEEYNKDFKRRFALLLGYEFKNIKSMDALKLIQPKTVENDIVIDISGRDFKRLQSYSKKKIDYHIIYDMVPRIALAFVEGVDIHFSTVQQAIIVGMGFQYKTMDVIAAELNIETIQAMAFFQQIMVKVVKYIEEHQKDLINRRKVNKSIQMVEENNNNLNNNQENNEIQEVEKKGMEEEDISEEKETFKETVGPEVLRERRMKLKELGIDDPDMYKISSTTHEVKEINELKGRIPTSLSIQRKDGVQSKPEVKYPKKPFNNKKKGGFKKFSKK